MSTRTSSSERRPDVVLSYARNNAALARATHKFLRSAGLDVWFDEASVRSGDHWQGAQYRALTRARHHLILLTDRTAPNWTDATLDFAARCAALNRSLETIPLLREGYDPGPIADRLAAYQVAHLAHDKAELDAQLRALVQRLREHPLRPSLPPAEQINPYPALRPHRLDEARFLFGRDPEASEAVARLGTQSDGKHRRWLRLVGPPGVGKTAFARAAVVPAVLRGGVQGAPLAWRVASVRLGARPLTALAEGLAEALAHDGDSGSVRQDLRKTGLADIAREQLPADHGLLLVIDHLEDVDEPAVGVETAERLDELLAEALEDFDQRLFLVTSERIDQSDVIERRLPRTAALLPTQGALYTLGDLTREGLKAMVEGPAALVGSPWPPPLARRLLDDAERQPGGPAALCWMCAALMLEERPSIQAYQTWGTLAHGVARVCDGQLAALSEDDQNRARGLLASLVEVGRGRGDRPSSATIEEAVAAAGSGPRAEALVERLEAGRPPDGGPSTPLVRIDGPGGHRRVRLGHWALLRLWPKLAGWVEADRPVLERREAATRTADGWVIEGRDANELPRDALLTFLAGEDLPEPKRKRFRTVLPTDVRRFIESAELAAMARKEQEEAAREAAHEAALQRLAGERDRARKRAATLRLIALGLGGLAMLLGAWALKSVNTSRDLQSQLNASNEREQNTADQLRRTERKAFDAEQKRAAAEAAQRTAERAQRNAEQLRDRAELNAESLLAMVIDTFGRGDEAFSRVPGADGKYARRVFTRGHVARLGESVEGAPENLHMRFLHGRQLLWLADRATGKKNRAARGSYLASAVDALEPLATAESPVAVHLAAFVDAQRRAGGYFLRETEGRPDEGADFKRGRALLEGALANADKLVTLDPANAKAHQDSRAAVRTRLGRFLVATGESDAGRKEIEQAVSTTRALSAAAADDIDLKVALARRLNALGDIETAARRWDAARKAFQESQSVTDPYKDGDRTDVARARRSARFGLRALPPAP